MNEQTKIKVVKMTESALPKIADVHRMAFAGYMNSRIGKGYVIAFLRWFILEETAIALMAMASNNQPCGYVVGVPAGYDKRINRELFGASVRGMIIRPWLVFDGQIRSKVKSRLKILLGLTDIEQEPPVLPEPVMYLWGIGTSETVRGQGYGKALMTAFENEARMREIRALCLSVYPQNSIARKLYERFGWKPFIEPSTKGIAMYYSKIL